MLSEVSFINVVFLLFGFIFGLLSSTTIREIYKSIFKKKIKK